MKKKQQSNGTNNKNNNTGRTTRPYFVISTVEGDIRRGKSTAELCEKFNKTPEDIAALISRAYHGSEGKIREINRVLQSNDKRYQQRQASQQNRAEAEVTDQNLSTPAEVVVTTEKTPQQIQEELVKKAEEDLFEKTQQLAAAEEEVKNATANKAIAQENLRKAREELTKADDALMMAESKKHTAEGNQKASRENYDLQVAKLGEMVKPKLIHISTAEKGIPGGKVYMSAYDYAKLSEADQAKVIAVDTNGSTFAAYPDDFYQYPTKLGMERYMSACQFALAYVKLILESEDGVELELHCEDEEIKYLAQIQQG